MVTPFQIQQLDGTLDPATWTPIVPPANFDHLTVSNIGGAAVLNVRGQSGTDTVALPVGAQQAFAPPPPRVNTRDFAASVKYRFPSGAIIGYLKPASGTGAGMELIWA